MKREIYTSTSLFNWNSENSDLNIFFELVKKYDELNPNAGFIVFGTAKKKGKMEILEVKRFRSFYDSVNHCIKDERDIEIFEEMSRFMIKVNQSDTEIEYCIRKLLPTGIGRLENNYPLDYRLTASPYSANIKLPYF